jgi:excisionase family DNA binding protein
MTTQEAATALGMTQMDVKELVEYGILPSSKVGKEYQIEPEEVLAYKVSRDRYEERMGDIVRTSVALGGYDLRFPPGR